MLNVFGLSHRSSPVEIREKVLIADRDLPNALEEIGHGVIVSTCNRTEIYQSTDSPAARAAARNFFAKRLGHPSTAAGHLYDLSGERALRHLFAVAAGLDSMVLGESQILAQVRMALEGARSAHAADQVLARAFRHAQRVGRRARAETFIGRHALSVSYAAVELARGVFGRLDDCRALVVGAGDMGELTTRALVDNGVRVVLVANRTFDRADALAAKFGGEAVSFDRLDLALRAADIVITSTDAPGYVVSAPAARAAAAGREARPLFLIDIAVPRDVDPAVREVDNVVLYDIDDLRARCEHNLEGRRAEIQPVQAIIDDEVERFTTWWHSRRVVPSIVALREDAERVRQEELGEALRMLPHLSGPDREVLDDLTRAIVNKLLHAPTVGLRQLAPAGDDELARARSLLGLGKPE